jgi:hypothetical protein
VNTLQHFGLWDATNGDQGQVLAMVYRYDQLNRLRKARGVIGLASTNTWHGVADSGPNEDNRYRSEYTFDANGNIETVQRYDGAGTGHYDSFAYHYHTSGGRKQQNRLYELIDAATMNTGSDIVTTATGFDNTPNGVNANNNYGYDALGNLVRDDREDIELIHWTVAGKVDSIQRPGTSSRSPLKLRYGASGQRVSKCKLLQYQQVPIACEQHIGLGCLCKSQKVIVVRIATERGCRCGHLMVLTNFLEQLNELAQPGLIEILAQVTSRTYLKQLCH